MKKLLFIVMVALPLCAWAAPFVKSDPYPVALTPKPTLCVVFVDAKAGVDSPVAGDPPACKYDVSGVAAGAHTVYAKFALVDPVWGRVESAASNVVNFTRPGPPAEPTGVGISP